MKDKFVTQIFRNLILALIAAYVFQLNPLSPRVNAISTNQQVEIVAQNTSSGNPSLGIDQDAVQSNELTTEGSRWVYFTNKFMTALPIILLAAFVVLLAIATAKLQGQKKTTKVNKK